MTEPRAGSIGVVGGSAALPSTPAGSVSGWLIGPSSRPKRPGQTRVARWPGCPGRRSPAGYGDPVRRNPDEREPRAPAVAIWTVTGLLAGVAVSVVAGSFPVPAIICGLIGLAFGLYMTRVKTTPGDD